MGRDDKPNGAAAGWKHRATKTRFENDIFRLREDEVELEGGKKIQYAYVERGEAVIVVPVTANGEMVLVKQYRYAVDQWCLEVPAGGMHDAGGASLEEVARKELREEVGGTAKSLTYVDFFYTANALSDEKCHVFLATDVTLEDKQETEPSETIELQLTPVEKAIELARGGAIKTAPCALAILMCEPLLAKLGQHHPTPDYLLET